jgi:hypothetical protein
LPALDKLDKNDSSKHSRHFQYSDSKETRTWLQQDMLVCKSMFLIGLFGKAYRLLKRILLEDLPPRIGLQLPRPRMRIIQDATQQHKQRSKQSRTSTTSHGS